MHFECNYLVWRNMSSSVTPSEAEGSGREREVRLVRSQMSRLRFAPLDMTREDTKRVRHAQ